MEYEGGRRREGKTDGEGYLRNKIERKTRGRWRKYM